MELTTNQRQKFREAIIDAYPSKKALEIMLSDKLNLVLDTIAGGDNYQEIVFDVIKWFQAQGRLNELLEAAKRANPDNSKLKELNFLENETEDTNQLSKKPKELIKKTKRHARENFPDENLEVVLWKLNHTKQVIQFRELSKTTKTIGFRIQTSSKNRVALVWLLKSLVNSLKLNDIICVDLPLDTYIYGGGKSQVILDSISEKLNLGCQPGTDVEKICNKILQEKQHILFLFYGVDFQKKSTLDRILKDFWLLLTEKVQQVDTNYYLLMCWIDCKKKIDWRDIYKFSDDPQDSRLKNTEALFDICITTKFKKDDLKTWLRGQDALAAISNFLKYDFLKDENEINKIIDQIWTKSKGEPEKLLEEIYKSCNLCWEDYESRWQKFR